MKRKLILSFIIAPVLSIAYADIQNTVETSNSAGPTGTKDTPTDSGTICYNFGIETACESCEVPISCPSTFSSPSLLVAGGLRYHTWSYDYGNAGNLSGCSPCGSGKGGSGGLPALEMTRYFMPQSFDIEHLTFGSLHGMKKYDQRLHFSTGFNSLVLIEYGRLNSKRRMRFNPARQCWTEEYDARGKGNDTLHLFNAAGLLITSKADRHTAHTCVTTDYQGNSVHFEILWDGSGEGIARPVAFLDRYGNAVEIEYTDAQPAFGTPAVDGFRPYFRKSLIRDAYGRELRFTYTELFQRFVATRVDLPNGGHITYDYAWNNGVQLEKVTHADGSESFFGTSPNPTTMMDEVVILDSKSSPGHRRKRVIFSSNQGFAPGGGVLTTVKARVRRAQNGAGEFVWDSRVTADNAERFVYSGGNKLSRFYFASGNNGLRSAEFLKDDSWKGSFHTADTSAWPKESELTDRRNNSKHMPILSTDTRGRKIEIARNANSHETLGELYPDGSSSQRTRNQFSQALVSSDRLGRVSTNTYSPLGDLLSRTNAAGSAAETTSTYLYNTRGQIIEARDALFDSNFPELHNTRYEYDANGYLVKKIEAADDVGGTRPETTFVYDAAGRITSTTDPEGRTISYEYDLENRLVKITYNDTSTELVEYGTGLEANLVKKRTDRNGIETTYVYDAADRIVSSETRDPSAPASAPALSKSSSTYLLGTRLKLTHTVDGNTTTYSYDHRNRVVATTIKPAPSKQLVTETEYDELSRVRSRSDAYGRKTFYLFDQNDRVIRTVTETVPSGLTGVPTFVTDSVQSASSKNYVFTDKNGVSLETDPDDEGRTHEVTYTDPRDLFLKNLARDLNDNAKYLITDSIYDAEGQLLASTDARGNVTWREYDELGRTTLTINALGTPAEIRSETDYDDNSNVIETRSPRYFSENINARDTFAYNGRNLRKEHTTAAGSTIETTQYWSYFLDGRNKLSTDFRGNIAENIWHVCCGRLQASVQQDGISASIINTDYKGQITHTAVVTNFNAAAYDYHNPVDNDTLQETTTRFDGRGRTTFTTRWLVPRGNVDDDARVSLGDPLDIPIAGLDGIPASEGLTTSYTYDEDLTDGKGLDATYTTVIADLTLHLGYAPFGVDATGSAVAVTNPAGETSAQFMDGAGRTILSVNPEGDASFMLYDKVVPAANIASPSPNISIPGSLLATTAVDANGNETTSFSDGAGRTIATKDGIGSFSAAAYDANGNVKKSRDPNGLGTDCSYDALNRDTNCADRQEQAEGAGRTKVYNSASQLVSSTNAEGHTQTNVFDERGRLVTHTDPNNITIEYQYDNNNNLVSLTDGRNNTRIWIYDARNLKIRKINPGNNDTLAYTYDALGRLDVKTDQRDDTCQMIYDLAGRMVSKQYKIDGQSLESVDTFVYDAASRLISSTKGRYDVVTNHTYALDSMPLSESVTVQNRTYTTVRSYDAANRPVSHTFADGKTQNWSYDERNLVTNLSYEGEQVLNQSFDAGYRLIGQSLGNGLSRQIAYGRLDNLRTSDLTSDNGGAIGSLHWTYQYNVDKQVTEESTMGSFLDDSSMTASYDPGDRLVSWTRSGNVAAGSRETEAWDYDKAGNHRRVTRDGTVQNRSHNRDNELRLVDGDNTRRDPKGNMTRDHERNRYRYDLDNRLRRVQMHKGASVRMRYDALGRRVEISERNNRKAIIWWGDQECAEHNNRAGQATLQNDLWAHPTALNKICARAVDGSKNDIEWYHKNYLDHVYAVSDDNGNIDEHYRYTAFGEVEIYNTLGQKLAQSAIGNTVLWNSRRFDQDTNLYYYKYRHYKADYGRWLGRDPIEEDGGINLYGFAFNMPINWWDLFGETPQQSSSGKATPVTGKPISDRPDTFDENVEGLNVKVASYAVKCAPWMKTAEGEYGVKETESKKTCHPCIRKYINNLPDGDAKKYMLKNGMDNQSWCAVFANWVLKQHGGSGLTGWDPIRAFGFQKVGTKSDYRFGAIVVFKHSHVGFVVGSVGKDRIVVLGGNQRNRVQYRIYKKTQVKVIRFPDCAKCKKCDLIKVNENTQKAIEKMNPDSNANDR